MLEIDDRDVVRRPIGRALLPSARVMTVRTLALAVAVSMKLALSRLGEIPIGCTWWR
jgi:hypothetical protein